MPSEVGVEVEADNKQDDFRFWGCHEENSVVVGGCYLREGGQGRPLSSVPD